MRNNKFKLLVLFILFNWLGNSLFAQLKFNYTWVSGINITYEIKFDGGGFKYLDSVHSLQYMQGLGGSNICDSNGNVMLMSSGTRIFNYSKNIIENGDSIGGKDLIKYYGGVSYYPQTSLFLPFKDSIYYMPYCTASDTEFNKWINISGHIAVYDILGYCKIDMKLNGGAGKVIQREIPLLENQTLSKTQMMACKHANGQDWWLFKQARGDNKVFKFLFTQDSVINYGTQSFPEPTFSFYDQGGQSMFSQDGTKYASTCRGTGKIFVADFDRCLGILSNPKVYILPEQNVHSPFDSTLTETFTEGLAFSPNGQFLYVNMYFNIQQLDLLDPDSATAWHHVAGLDTLWASFQSYSNMYLGPDDKLYIGNFSNGSKQMSRIDNPDIKGAGCNFCPRCLRMPDGGIVAPPCMPNYNLGASQPCWPLGTVNSIVSSRNLLVYPNPAQQYVTIEYKLLSTETAQFNLFDILGNKVISTTLDGKNLKTILDIQHLAQGVYSYQLVSSDAKLFTGKLIKE